MRELFNDILSVEGIRGLILFSFSGDLIYKNFNHKAAEEDKIKDLRRFLESLAGIRETDLIFTKGRLYVRRTDIGYLVVVMGLFVPVAMMRLQCDILLPSLKSALKKKGIRRLFKR
jgi:hypothetical protein